MTGENMTIFEKKHASEAAKELLSSALSELKNVAETQPSATPRLFFPNGIELISITVKLLSDIDIVFKVAGAKGISGLLNSEEIEEEHTDKMAEEVME